MANHPQQFFAFIRDGFSKIAIAPEGRDGWELVGAFDSRMDAWSFAAANYSASPHDYTDEMRPVPMTEQIPLFRSISLPELLSIRQENSISGGANTFNGFDRRPFVFFGDELNEHLIWQGEDDTREANYAVQREFAEQFGALNGAEVEFRRSLLPRAKRAIAAADRSWLTRVGLSTIDWDEFIDLNKPLYPLVLREMPDRKELGQENVAFGRRRVELQDALNCAYRETLANLRMERPQKTITSVVLETRPLKGGLHYSKAHGASGLGQNSEYGLFPGQVTLDDIERAHWVKDRQVIHVSERHELEDAVDMALDAQQNFSPLFKA